MPGFTDYMSRRMGGQSVSSRREATLSLLEQNPDAKLLDLGCGDGEFSLKLAERIGTRKVYGVDIVEQSLTKAKAKGIQVYLGDLNEKLPFEDGSFDVVLASEVIEHLHDTDGFFREVRRVLRNGGYAVIETPNLAAFHNILALLLGKQPFPAVVSNEIYAGIWGHQEKQIGSEEPGHLRIFTLSALKELLEYYGFQIEKSVGSGFYPFPTPLTKVMCFLDKRHAAYMTVKARKKKRE